MQREAAGVVAFGRAGFDVADVIPHAREAREAGARVEHLVDLFDAHAVVAQEAEDDASVEVAAAARAHHEPFERREPHRGLDRAPVLHRADRRAVAQVAGDHPHLLGGRVHRLRRLTRHILVRGAVEAVASEPVRGGHGAVDRVGLRSARQRRVERGVEHGDVRHVREELSRGADPAHVVGVVQRREGRERVERSDDLVGDAHGPRELGATVHDAVHDAGDRRAAAEELRQRQLQRRAVRRRLGLQRASLRRS